MCLLPSLDVLFVRSAWHREEGLAGDTDRRRGGRGVRVAWLQLKPLNLGRSAANWLSRGALANP